MRFLLEFVSCCGATGGESSVKESLEPNRRRSEETRTLMVHRTLQTPNARRSRRRKRGRVGLGYPSSAAAMAEWKPTLCSIAEDNVVLVEERTERVVKRNGSGGRRSGGSREVANVSNYNDYDRRSNQLTVIPTFSASPFMI